VAVALVVVARRIPHPVIPAVSGQPEWLQFVEVLRIRDSIQYWVHRAFHRRNTRIATSRLVLAAEETLIAHRTAATVPTTASEPYAHRESRVRRSSD
jgi:hypothetical protein